MIFGVVKLMTSISSRVSNRIDESNREQLWKRPPVPIPTPGTQVSTFSYIPLALYSDVAELRKWLKANAIWNKKPVPTRKL